MVFRLNPRAPEPVYRQVMQQIRHAVETGVLLPGNQLPAIRAFAEELGVSRCTVLRVYSELEHEGLLEARPGRGVYIAAGNRRKFARGSTRPAQERVSEFVQTLKLEGLSPEEIRRLFEAELLQSG